MKSVLESLCLWPDKLPDKAAKTSHKPKCTHSHNPKVKVTISSALELAYQKILAIISNPLFLSFK